MEKAQKDERKKEEMGVSSRGMYMRNIMGIIPKWKDIRIADIITNGDDICSTANIIELSEIVRKILEVK